MNHQEFLSKMEQELRQYENLSCYRRNYYAVIVNQKGEVVSSGHNHCPSTPCTSLNRCIRDELRIPRGTQYEICRAVHAEQEALIKATYSELYGGTLYLVGLDYKTNELVGNCEPCIICKRLIMDSTIKEVVTLSKSGISVYKVNNWIRNNITSTYEDTYRER